MLPSKPTFELLSFWGISGLVAPTSRHKRGVSTSSPAMLRALLLGREWGARRQSATRIVAGSSNLKLDVGRGAIFLVV